MYDQMTITAIAMAITAVAGAYTAYLTKRAQPVLASIQATGEANHVLSNSAMGGKLTDGVEDAEAALVLLREIAGLNSSAENIARVTAGQLKVDQRKKLLQDHLIQQATVDAMPHSQPSVQSKTDQRGSKSR